jgi:dephospho-CoA kinase
MFVIGLTGGIGSGKSVVGRYFSELGITVVDADRVAREVVEKGSSALENIAQHFGGDILLENGELNRAALRRIIFENPAEKVWLESLLHPLIRASTQEKLVAANGPYVVLESPLLLEMGQQTTVKRVLVVDVPEEVQIERACARDSNSRDQIRAIMASQITRKDRLAAADDVIDNSGSVEELRAKVEALHHFYLEIALAESTG